MFPACPTKMLPTLRLKTGRLAIGNVYDRPVSFQVQSVCVYGLSGGGAQVLNHNRPGCSSRQDGYSVLQDGQCV